LKDTAAEMARLDSANGLIEISSIIRDKENEGEIRNVIINDTIKLVDKNNMKDLLPVIYAYSL
jgi:hypothetical protein